MSQIGTVLANAAGDSRDPLSRQPGVSVGSLPLKYSGQGGFGAVPTAGVAAQTGQLTDFRIPAGEGRIRSMPVRPEHVIPLPRGGERRSEEVKSQRCGASSPMEASPPVSFLERISA